MTQSLTLPGAANDFCAAHVSRLLRSLRRWTGTNLVDSKLPAAEQARLIFDAPYAVLSHNSAADPILNYGNLTGMRLFQLTWEDLMHTPSRLTAEPVHREERARLLEAVTRQGYIDDYRGIRISKTGRRFLIEKATVWTVLDEQDRPCGQAATFSDWKFLDEKA